jgi:5-methylthioadenosine/S-adenosylhomocysteine deaminase
VEGRIQAWFGLHAPFTVSAGGFRRIARLAERYDVGIHTHLSETAAEVDTVRTKHGLSPVEYLDSLGLLSRRLLAAHCVWLTDDKIQLLADRYVGVAYNPSSNIKLASGVAPVPELLAAGIRVGLGTDSNLSNNSLVLKPYLNGIAHQIAFASPRYAENLASIARVPCLMSDV